MGKCHLLSSLAEIPFTDYISEQAEKMNYCLRLCKWLFQALRFLPVCLQCHHKPPSTHHLGVPPASVLNQSDPCCRGSRRTTTPDKNTTPSCRTSRSSIPAAQAMSRFAAAAAQSLTLPLPALKAPAVAQESRSTGEERFAQLSREDSKSLVCTRKGGLSWRLSPPLSIPRLR